MSIKDKVLNFLYEDQIYNQNIINLIESNLVEDIKFYNKTVWVIQKRGGGFRNVISTKGDKDDIKVLMDQFSDIKNFGATKSSYIDILSKGRRLTFEEPCFRFSLSKGVKIDKNIGGKAEILPLEPKHAKLVNKFWPYQDGEKTEKYIKTRIENGISGAVYIDGKPVCWAIVQDDGAMGFLHTLEQYRNRKYAIDVTLYLIEKIRELDKIPFVYIVRKNRKSLNLIDKLKFIETGEISWFGFEEY